MLHQNPLYYSYGKTYFSNKLITMFIVEIALLFHRLAVQIISPLFWLHPINYKLKEIYEKFTGCMPIQDKEGGGLMNGRGVSTWYTGSNPNSITLSESER